MNDTLEQTELEMPVKSFKQSAKVSKAMNLINSIDLTMVKMKLMDEDEGQGWDQEYTDYAEVRYKRYLCMLMLSPEISSVPTLDIDLFWHQHILDTRAYARDCQRVFGEFVHHYPYFGLRGEEDAQNLLDSFEETKVLYAKFFGEDYTKKHPMEKASKCHLGCSTSVCKTCSRGCSGVDCKSCKKDRFSLCY